MLYRSKLVAWFNFRFDKSQFSVKKKFPHPRRYCSSLEIRYCAEISFSSESVTQMGRPAQTSPFHTPRRSHLWDGGLVDQARANMKNRFPMCSDLICGHQHNKKGSGSEHFLWGKFIEGGKTWFLIKSLGRGCCVWWTKAWFYHFSWHNIKDWPPEPDVRYQCVPLSC